MKLTRYDGWVLLDHANTDGGEHAEGDSFFDVGYKFSSAAEAEMMLAEVQNSIGAPLIVAHDGSNFLLVICTDDVYEAVNRVGSEFDHCNSPYHYIGHYYITKWGANSLDRTLARFLDMKKTADRRLMVVCGSVHPYWNIAAQDLTDREDDQVFSDPQY